MTGVPVYLTNLELWSLMELAKRRNDLKESVGVKSQKIDKELTDQELHYIGLKAEYAVAKLLRVSIDMNNTLAGDGGIDLNYRGLSIDVKYSTKDLKYRPDKEITSDIIVLVQPLDKNIVNMPYYASAEEEDYISKPSFAWKHVLVVGWISAGDFKERHTIRNFGYSDCMFMSAENMNNMYDLREYAVGQSMLNNLQSVFVA